MTRRLVRGALTAATVVAIAVGVAALLQLGGRDPTSWATVAAVLAVLAAVASAWTSQRVVELQEDSLEPILVASVDMRSRYGIAQFRLTNKGQSAAFDIRLEWTRPLLTAQGNQVTVGKDGYIPVLAPGECASALLGGSHDIFPKSEDTTCSGKVTFRNAARQRRETEFVASAEHGRRALLHDDEIIKTQYELQKLPDELRRVSKELERIRELLAKARE